MQATLLFLFEVWYSAARGIFNRLQFGELSMGLFGVVDHEHAVVCVVYPGDTGLVLNEGEDRLLQFKLFIIFGGPQLLNLGNLIFLQLLGLKFAELLIVS